MNEAIARRLEQDREEILQAALFRSLPPERRSLRADVTANHTLESLMRWAGGSDESASAGTANAKARRIGRRFTAQPSSSAGCLRYRPARSARYAASV